MLNGPALWDLILGDMPEGAIIAGGAVRDYLLGVEPKDIDVFMSTEMTLARSDDVEENYAFTVANDCRTGLHRIDNICERKEEYEAMTGIDLVSSGEMYGHKVDAVVLDEMGDGLELVNGFDFAINQCWYVAGKEKCTGACIDDIAGKTVTLLSNDRRERSLKRFARFNERHGNAYTFKDLT